MKNRPDSVSIFLLQAGKPSAGEAAHLAEALDRMLREAGLSAHVSADAYPGSADLVVIVEDRGFAILPGNTDERMRAVAKVLRDCLNRELDADGDDQGIADVHSLSRRLGRLDSHARRLEASLHDLRHEAGELRRRKTELEAQLGAVLESSSWRVTRPMRVAKEMMADLRAAPRRLPRLLRSVLRHVVAQLLRNRFIRGAAHRLARHFPALQPHLTAFLAYRRDEDTRHIAELESVNPALREQLGPRARATYLALRAAIDNEEREAK